MSFINNINKYIFISGHQMKDFSTFRIGQLIVESFAMQTRYKKTNFSLVYAEKTHA